jgi:hypothetical protein
MESIDLRRIGFVAICKQRVKPLDEVVEIEFAGIMTRIIFLISLLPLSNCLRKALTVLQLNPAFRTSMGFQQQNHCRNLPQSPFEAMQL